MTDIFNRELNNEELAIFAQETEIMAKEAQMDGYSKEGTPHYVVRCLERLIRVGVPVNKTYLREQLIKKCDGLKV